MPCVRSVSLPCERPITPTHLCTPAAGVLPHTAVSAVGGAFDNLLEPYDDGPLLHTAASLGTLTGLTSLQLDMSDRKPDDPFWRSLAYLTTLKSLQMADVDYDCLGGVLTLRECKQLTRLHINHEDFWPEQYLEVGGVRCADWSAGCARTWHSRRSALARSLLGSVQTRPLLQQANMRTPVTCQRSVRRHV